MSIDKTQDLGAVIGLVRRELGEDLAQGIDRALNKAVLGQQVLDTAQVWMQKADGGTSDAELREVGEAVMGCITRWLLASRDDQV